MGIAKKKFAKKKIMYLVHESRDRRKPFSGLIPDRGDTEVRDGCTEEVRQFSEKVVVDLHGGGADSVKSSRE